MKVRHGEIIELDPEAMEPNCIRDWTPEDLEHVRDAILTVQEKTGATALPGLEAVYHQIGLRLMSEESLDD